MLYTTSYRRASTVAVVTGMLHVFLAAMREEKEKAPPKPWLFRGQLAQPLLFRDGLLTLREVVAARFYRPDLWRLMDPVVTTERDWVRLECFSSDGGVYARVDLAPDTFHEGELGNEGTTNVDFGPDFAAELSLLRPGKRSAFEVGEESVSLVSEASAAVEHKVELPERWVRGFLQVQAIQRAAQPCFSIDRVRARMLLNALPAQGSSPLFATPEGTLAPRKPRSGPAVEASGIHRLRLLRRVAPHALGLSVWAVEGGPTFWMADLGTARVTMGLSSAVNQGFSGDGEALRSARVELDEVLIEASRRAIATGHRFTLAEMARALGVSEGIAAQVVDLLSEQGLLGYDLPEGRYYRRDLPYVTRTGFVAQPRDAHSRRLVDEGKVELKERRPCPEGMWLSGWVQGDHATYRVRVQVDQDGTILEGDCTCQWIRDHGMQRGPCKHLLAMRLAGQAHE